MTNLLLEIVQIAPSRHHLLDLRDIVDNEGDLCVAIIVSLLLLGLIVKVAEGVEVEGRDGGVVRVPIVQQIFHRVGLGVIRFGMLGTIDAL
jgi:hypothetical protein